MNEVIETVELGQYGEFELRLEILPDYDTTTLDDEGLTPLQVAAWRENEWRYVVRHVIARKAGIDLGDAYLSATEYGEYPCTSEDDVLIDTSSIYGDEIAYDTKAFCTFVIDEAITKAQNKLAELAE